MIAHHTLMIQIYNSRHAAINAQNQWFKTYWHNVADKLEEKLRSL